MTRLEQRLVSPVVSQAHSLALTFARAAGSPRYGSTRDTPFRPLSRACRALVSVNQSGHTLAELSVAMGVSAILSTGFFVVALDLSHTIQQQVIVGQYQDNVNLALTQLARDFRLAGANATANPYLFDKDPPTDVPVDIDPDQDGDITNALLVRADKRGLSTGDPDGDAEDTLETVYIHYDPSLARLWRHTWRVPPDVSGTELGEHTQNQAAYDMTPFLDGICSFKMTYLDTADQVTTDQDQVASVHIELTSASGPKECFQSHSFTRSYDAVIRIRNR